jgi:predicted outer membrane repeat protein
MRSVAALFLGLLLGAAVSVRAATVTFDVDDVGEAGDVCHTASNTCTLLAALQQASAPSADTFVINLKAATYTVSATLPAVARTITIQGTDAATRTIRSSDTGRPLLFNVTTGGNLTLDHVTISNAGHGAISIVDGSASITNSVVTGNAQEAVYINTTGPTPSNLVLSNDLFSDNRSTVGPGALEVSFANLTAATVTFQNNTGTVGGVAYIHGSAAYTQTFTGCTFTGNQSTNGYGGAVFADANDGASPSTRRAASRSRSSDTVSIRPDSAPVSTLPPGSATVAPSGPSS